MKRLGAIEITRGTSFCRAKHFFFFSSVRRCRRVVTDGPLMEGIKVSNMIFKYYFRGLCVFLSGSDLSMGALVSVSVR